MHSTEGLYGWPLPGCWPTCPCCAVQQICTAEAAVIDADLRGQELAVRGLQIATLRQVWYKRPEHHEGQGEREQAARVDGSSQGIHKQA